MLVNFAVRFQAQSNSFFSESVSVTVTPEDIGAKVTAKNRAAVEAELTYQAAKGCYIAAMAAGAMEPATAKHRLKPFKRLRDRLNGDGEKEKKKKD